MNDEKLFFLVQAKEGSRCRYTEEDGLPVLHGVLPDGLNYPENYGTVSCAIDDAGRPLEGFLISSEPLEVCSKVEARPVASIRTREEGRKGDKIVMVPVEDPKTGNIEDKSDLGENLLIELRAFTVEKMGAEDKETEVREVLDHEDAKRLVEHCKKIYKRRGK